MSNGVAQYGSIVAQGLGLAATGTALGIAVSSGISLAAASATTAPLTLGIGALVAGVVVLVSQLFHGADPRQVPAAKIEQVFELASDTVLNLIQAGLITPQEGVTALNAFLQAAVQMENQANLGPATVKGIRNVTTVLNNQIAKAQAMPNEVKGSSDLSRAKQYYAGQGTAGLKWYPESIDTAGKVVDAFLATLPPRSSLLSIPGASSLAGVVQSIGAEVSSLGPFAKAVLLGGAIFLGLKFIL